MTDYPYVDLPSDQVHHGDPKVRECLRCKSEFQSAWAGERICARCKGSSAWRSGIPLPTTTSGSKR